MIRKPKQKGAILVLVLVVFTGATLLVLASVDSGILELRMAGSVESTARNFQLGQAAIDFTLDDASNLPAAGPLNTPSNVTLDDAVFDVAGSGTVTATATRLEDCAPPPRSNRASSLTAFSSFKYEVNVSIVKNSSGEGQTEMTQGYLLLGPRC